MDKTTEKYDCQCPHGFEAECSHVSCPRHETTDADKIIAHLKECRRNQADTILQLLAALEAIRDMAINAIGQEEESE